MTKPSPRIFIVTSQRAHLLTRSPAQSPRRAGGSSHEIFGAFGAFAVQSPPRGSADNICGQLASLSGQRHCRILCRHSSPRAPRVQPLSRFKHENSTFSSLFAPQSRHSLFALDEKSFLSRILSAARLAFHGTVVGQCPRQTPAFSGLRANTLFHRSEFFFRAARAAEEN